MKGTNWGWRPVRTEGIWKHGCKWAQPIAVAAPWITLGLLLVEFLFIEGRLTAAPGVVFNLPATTNAETATPGSVAIVVPLVRDGTVGRETFVFFDDARYSLADDSSVESFRMRLSERAQNDECGTLLILTDARVSAGDVMRLTSIARDAGMRHVQIGERRQ